MYCGLLSFPLERLERDFSGSESKTVKASEIKAPPPFWWRGWERESGVLAHPQPHSEFEASLGSLSFTETHD